MQACFFGQYLQKKSIVSSAQLAAALERQRQSNCSLGDLAVEEGLLTRTQVDQLNKDQYSTDILLGELAVEKELVSSYDMDHLIYRQRAEHQSLGNVLIEQGVIDSVKLDSLLADFNYFRTRLRDEYLAGLKTLPQSECLKTFLNELVKTTQRTCHKMVAIGSLFRETELPSNTDYFSLQKIEAQGDHKIQSIYFGLLLSKDQVVSVLDRFDQVVDVENDESVLKAVQSFTKLVVDNACRKLKNKGVECTVEPCLTFHEDYHLPISGHLARVEMVTEDSGFNALCLY